MSIGKCKKCCESFDSVFSLALLASLGATVSPNPNECPNGGNHDFEYIKDEVVKGGPNDQPK